MRWFVSLIPVLLALTVGIPLTTAQEATPEAGAVASDLTSTDIHFVVPFGPEGLNPALTAQTTEDGVCTDPSAIALDRPDAWDCLAESGQFYDPCFENPFLAPDEPGQVACFADPFTTEVILLTLTTPIDHDKESPTPAVPGANSDPDGAIDEWDLPWALELANGERCTLFHGTLMILAGQVAHYACDGGGVILGEVDHSRPVWTASYIAAGDWTSFRVEIRAVWT